MIRGESGIGYSYECEDLIKELEEDLKEFGADTMFAVWLRRFPQCENLEFAVNYDFVEEEYPIKREEFNEGERLVFMQGDVLLALLKKQDDPVN